MFPTFERCRPSNETDANKRRVSKCEWFRKPFAANNVCGLTCEQQQLIDISCDGSVKDMFDADKLPQTTIQVHQTKR
jgi:hypothetical protein